ncbi:hypothetical protein N665_0026s0067 [Sinapis alba]|nr:hypothetical protein N665_0026s0067 [Sinapis alba]
MDYRTEDTASITLPERMFAIGEETIGVRVTLYHKHFAISKILCALEDDEIDVLRRSQFGRLVEIAEKPTFSGRFGRYLIFRQLKVRKKHEAWFLKRAKKQIGEKPYWGELFGTLKEVPVTSIVKMLKKKEVSEKETRVKYALLALLASVILPTTHTPRISHEHEEKIKELDLFLAFPWGRLSFDLLMSSIKERNEVSLSQNTIALKGFVLALQLVMVEVVPALTEPVHEGGSSDSEGDFAEDEDLGDELCQGKRSISPRHARETDCAGNAAVLSIISVGNKDLSGQSKFGWSDEEDDVGVNNLLHKIQEGFQFSHSSFKGGASEADVARMREERINEAEIRKTIKHKTNLMTGDAVGLEYIATTVKARLSEDISRIEVQGDIVKMITPHVIVPSHPSMQPEVEEGPVLSSHNYNQTAMTIPHLGAYIIHGDISTLGSDKTNPKQGCVVSSPPVKTSTQVDATHIIEKAMRFVDNAEIEITNDHTVWVTLTRNNDLSPREKSKWQKVLPRALVGDYECDKTFLTRAWEVYVAGNHTRDKIDHAAKFSKLIEMLKIPFSFNVNGVKVDSKDLSVLVDKSSQLPAKVVDVLTHHIRSVYFSHTDHPPPTLSTSWTQKSFKFPPSLCESLIAASLNMEASRFYFPFNFDKTHWVGVCIDTTNWQLVVLDCNTSIHTDALLSKQMRPVSVMFPYVMRQVGKPIGAKELKAFAIDRPRTVPQNHNQFELAITAVLLIQAHTFGGVYVCKCITPNVLDAHVQRDATKIVEENHGII